MSIPSRLPAARIPAALLAVLVLLSFLAPLPGTAQEGGGPGVAAVLAKEAAEDLGGDAPAGEEPAGQGPEKPSISFPAADMEEGLRAAASQVGDLIETGRRSLLERKPLGFDLHTVDRLKDWGLRLPLEVPRMVRMVMEQGRLLGFVGSLIMLLFLGAIFYSLFWQQKVLDLVERAVEPLRSVIPEFFYPYFLAVLKVVVASLIPLILFGVYSLIRAFITFRAPWFLITGDLLMLWSVGALLIRLLRESLTRGLFPIPESYGRAIFRVARIFILYTLFSFAVFLGAEAFQIPEDVLALLRFVLSLSIVLMSLILLVKKRAILGVLPDLPYKSYQVFLRGLRRFYFPVMFLTFLTGLLWCVGYHKLCIAIWTKTWAVAGAFLAIVLAYHVLQGWLRQWAREKLAGDEAAKALHDALHSVLLYTTIVVLWVVVLDLLGLYDPIQRAMSFPVLVIGKTSMSFWTLVKAVLILVVFVFFSRLLRAWLDYKLYPSIHVEEGLAYAINTFLHYVLLSIGFLVSLRSVGLDLRILMVFAGALGIGIGLGMQNMAANLISGFSLVFGQKIRKGDMVQVGDTVGVVREVGLRATKVRTLDNIEYLVPNSELTSNTIVNYTLSDPLIRVHVPVGVSYSADPRQVEKILLDAAAAEPQVARHKAPEVWFSEYGDNSINFTLLVWVDVRKTSVSRVRSRLYFAIFEALAEAGIEIPFPQRDIHIRSGLFPAPGGGCPWAPAGPGAPGGTDSE